MDFGAFVEIEPGIEASFIFRKCPGAKRFATQRRPQAGDRVDAVILSVKPEERRIALASSKLSPTLLDARRNFPAGSQVEGPVTKLMNFGAFVQIADGVEGLSTSAKSSRTAVSTTQRCLRAGQIVKAQVLHRSGKTPDQAQHEAAHPHRYRRVHRRTQSWDEVSGRVLEQSPTSPMSNWATASAPLPHHLRHRQPIVAPEVQIELAAAPSPTYPICRQCSKPAGKATPHRRIQAEPWPKAKSAASRL